MQTVRKTTGARKRTARLVLAIAIATMPLTTGCQIMSMLGPLMSVFSGLSGLFKGAGGGAAAAAAPQTNATPPAAQNASLLKLTATDPSDPSKVGGKGTGTEPGKDTLAGK